MSSRARLWSWVLIAVSFAWLGAGCAKAPEPQPVVEQAPTPPPPPEPALTASADTQLTLFGELPSRSRVPFSTAAAGPMKQHSFTSEGADFDADVSPDGQWIVFASTRHSMQPNLYLKKVDGVAVTQLTDDPAGDVQPCFAPDGKSVVFSSNRTGNWDLWQVGLTGGQAVQLTHAPQHEVHPSLSPDGRRLAYCQFNERADRWELWVADLGQSGSRKMIGAGLFPEWSPSSESIVYQRARQRGGRWFSIWRVDLVNGEPSFPIELAASPHKALILPGWSPDGQWVTYCTAEPAAAEQTAMAEQPAVANATTAESRGDVWVMRADGTGAVRLTDGSGCHFASVWGPAQRVYFTSVQNGIENIWSVQAPALGETAAAEPPADAPAGPAAEAESAVGTSGHGG